MSTINTAQKGLLIIAANLSNPALAKPSDPMYSHILDRKVVVGLKELWRGCIGMLMKVNPGILVTGSRDDIIKEALKYNDITSYIADQDAHPALDLDSLLS